MTSMASPSGFGSVPVIADHRPRKCGQKLPRGGMPCRGDTESSYAFARAEHLDIAGFGQSAASCACKVVGAPARRKPTSGIVGACSRAATGHAGAAEQRNERAAVAVDTVIAVNGFFD